MFKVVRSTRKNTKRSGSPTATSTIETVDPAQLDSSMNIFFNAESASAFMKPWLRLERGLRLQRFRAFVEEYPGLSTEERESLLAVLLKANDAKCLNTKQQIQYEDGKILSIRGLKMTRIGDGPATFKIEPVRPTKKKSASATSDE
jgi:hypothetical protein